MKWKSALQSALVVTTFALAFTACESTGPMGGTVVVDPSSDDVTRMESQWGMKPRVVKPRLRPMEPGDLPLNTTPTPTPTYQDDPTPPPVEPAPAPALQEPATTPSPEVDAATIQKLR